MSGKGGGFLLAAVGLMFAPVVAPALFGGAGAAATGAMTATAGAAAGAAPMLGTTAAATGLAGGAGTAIGAGTVAAGAAGAATTTAVTTGGLGGFLGQLFNPANPMLGQIVGGIGTSMAQQAEWDHDQEVQDQRTASYDVSMPNMRSSSSAGAGGGGDAQVIPRRDEAMMQSRARGLEPQQDIRGRLDYTGQDPAAMKPQAAQADGSMMATKLPQMRPPRAGMAMTANGGQAQPQRPRVRYNPQTQRIEMS